MTNKQTGPASDGGAGSTKNNMTKKQPTPKRGSRGPAKGCGGRPRGPATERIGWRLPVGTVAAIERLAQAEGLTGSQYLAALAEIPVV